MSSDAVKVERDGSHRDKTPEEGSGGNNNLTNQLAARRRPGRPRLELHVCPMEGKCFKSRDDLYRHIRYHTKEKPFVCLKCDKWFSEKYLRNRHLASEHPTTRKTDSGVRGFRCSDCDDKFPLVAQLIAHRRLIHRTTRQQPSPIPNQGRFKVGTKRGLYSQQSRPALIYYKCDKCCASFAFQSSESLRSHIISCHSGPIQKPVNAAPGSRAQIPVVINTRVRGKTPPGKCGSRGAISIGNRGNKLKKWNSKKGSCMEITFRKDPLAPDEEPESGSKKTAPEHAPRPINTDDPPQSDPNPVPSSAPVNGAGALVPHESTNAGNRALTQLVPARTGVPTQPPRNDGSSNLKCATMLTRVKTSASESPTGIKARNQGSSPTDQYPSSNLMEPGMINITTATSTVKARRAIMMALCPAMFRGVPPGESLETVDASEFQDDVVKALLEYIYSGETKLLNDSAKIPGLLQIARKYEQKDLEQECLAALRQNFQPTVDSVLESLLFAHEARLEDIKVHCWDFIRANKQPVQLSASYKRLIKSEHAPLLFEILLTFV